MNSVFYLIPSKKLMTEDLIQNAYALFDEHSSQSQPVPFNVAETDSTHTYGRSSLFLSPELPQSVELSDASSESRPTPLSIDLLSPLLGLSSSKTLTEGVETTVREGLIPDAEPWSNSTPLDVVPLHALTSVFEWRLNQSRSPPDPDMLRIPQSPPESVLSSMSDFPLSSATSLQTRMWGFSP